MKAWLILLEYRTIFREFFQKYKMFVMPAIRFTVCLLSFIKLNSFLGYNTIIGSPVVIIGLSVICAFAPMIFTVLIMLAYAIAHIYAASAVLSIIVFVLFLLVYLMAARFSGKYAYMIIAMPILYFFGLQYVGPIFAAIAGGAAGIIPVACGTIFYYILKLVNVEEFMGPVKGVDAVLELLLKVIDVIVNCKEMVISVVIFAAVIIIISLVKKFSISWVYELSIIIGGIINIILFGIVKAVVEVDISFVSIFFQSLLAIVIMLIIQFFRLLVDYTSVVTTQFEDDEYLYFVKAVPKIEIAKSSRQIKSFSESEKNKKQQEENMLEEDDDEDIRELLGMTGFKEPVGEEEEVPEETLKFNYVRKPRIFSSKTDTDNATEKKNLNLDENVLEAKKNEILENNGEES